jgi:pyrroline-5-carboxylate reductase
MNARVLLAGCGNMGYAMLAGWLKSGLLKGPEAFVVEPIPDLKDRAAALGAEVLSYARDIPTQLKPELIVFAVKPQVIREVATHYRRFVATGSTFLSVAAGTKIKAFEDILGADAPVIRCMPNTPAAIGKGMMVTVTNGKVAPAVMTFVDTLLAASGEVAAVESEDLMDAVTAVSGSGPAYVFHFIEALTAAAESAGLPRQTARLLAMQTVHGAAVLAFESQEDPGKLRQQVTSPNGTTAAALAVLMGEDRLKKLVGEAVEAARLRSIELGQ